MRKNRLIKKKLKINLCVWVWSKHQIDSTETANLGSTKFWRSLLEICNFKKFNENVNFAFKSCSLKVKRGTGHYILLFSSLFLHHLCVLKFQLYFSCVLRLHSINIRAAPDQMVKYKTALMLHNILTTQCPLSGSNYFSIKILVKEIIEQISEIKVNIKLAKTWSRTTRKS